MALNSIPSDDVWRVMSHIVDVVEITTGISRVNEGQNDEHDQHDQPDQPGVTIDVRSYDAKLITRRHLTVFETLKCQEMETDREQALSSDDGSGLCFEPVAIRQASDQLKKKAVVKPGQEASELIECVNGDQRITVADAFLSDTEEENLKNAIDEGERLDADLCEKELDDDYYRNVQDTENPNLSALVNGLARNQDALVPELAHVSADAMVPKQEENLISLDDTPEDAAEHALIDFNKPEEPSRPKTPQMCGAAVPEVSKDPFQPQMQYSMTEDGRVRSEMYIWLGPRPLVATPVMSPRPQVQPEPCHQPEEQPQPQQEAQLDLHVQLESQPDPHDQPLLDCSEQSQLGPHAPREQQPPGLQAPPPSLLELPLQPQCLLRPFVADPEAHPSTLAEEASPNQATAAEFVPECFVGPPQQVESCGIPMYSRARCGRPYSESDSFPPDVPRDLPMASPNTIIKVSMLMPLWADEVLTTEFITEMSESLNVRVMQMAETMNISKGRTAERLYVLSGPCSAVKDGIMRLMERAFLNKELDEPTERRQHEIRLVLSRYPIMQYLVGKHQWLLTALQAQTSADIMIRRDDYLQTFQLNLKVVSILSSFAKAQGDALLLVLRRIGLDEQVQVRIRTEGTKENRRQYSSPHRSGKEVRDVTNHANGGGQTSSNNGDGGKPLSKRIRNKKKTERRQRDKESPKELPKMDSKELPKMDPKELPKMGPKEDVAPSRIPLVAETARPVEEVWE